MPTSHIPVRTCIATGVKKPKQELIRLVRLPDGSVVVDPSGKLRGRGASIDCNLAAFDLAVKKGAIGRALKLEQKLTSEQVAVLRQDFISTIETRAFRPGGKSVVIRVTKDQLPAS